MKALPKTWINTTCTYQKSIRLSANIKSSETTHHLGDSRASASQENQNQMFSLRPGIMNHSIAWILTEWNNIQCPIRDWISSGPALQESSLKSFHVWHWQSKANSPLNCGSLALLSSTLPLQVRILPPKVYIMCFSESMHILKDKRSSFKSVHWELNTQV